MKTKRRTKQILSTSPVRCRGGIARGLKKAAAESAPAVEREGGMFGAGLIRAAAIVTRGEALGHGMWLDGDFLQQTHDAIEAAGERGLKSRFTHPGLSADGLGKFLGRLNNPQLDGDIVRADIHLSKAAHNSPDGDLAGHVMDLAAEDPSAFGMSIVFWADRGAEKEFEGKHSDEDGKFTSPDKDNESNFPHARLAELDGADVVDEPAANPGGLFSRGQELAREGWSVMDYALGLTDERPALCALDADPDRIKQFVNRYLETHGLEVRKRDQQQEKNMAPGNQQIAQPTVVQTEDTVEQLAEKRAAEMRKVEREEEAKIRALCSEVGHADAAEKFLKANLSYAEVKDQLLELRKKEFALSGTAGGNVTQQPAKPDPDAAAKAEYAAQREVHERLGVSEAQYIASRRNDQQGGIVQPKA